MPVSTRWRWLPSRQSNVTQGRTYVLHRTDLERMLEMESFNCYTIYRISRSNFVLSQRRFCITWLFQRAFVLLWSSILFGSFILSSGLNDWWFNIWFYFWSVWSKIVMNYAWCRLFMLAVRKVDNLYWILYIYVYKPSLQFEMLTVPNGMTWKHQLKSQIRENIF